MKDSRYECPLLCIRPTWNEAPRPIMSGLPYDRTPWRFTKRLEIFASPKEYPHDGEISIYTTEIAHSHKSKYMADLRKETSLSLSSSILPALDLLYHLTSHVPHFSPKSPIARKPSHCSPPSPKVLSIL